MDNIKPISELIDYEPPSWDELFMRHVYLIASKSKDRKTKIGAVLVRDRRVISEGYNGMPQGVDDNVEERHERPEKYHWAEHAERNAVFDCANRGVISRGSIIYTNGIPCSDCTRSVIQAGIKQIIVHKQWQDIERLAGNDKWADSCMRSDAMIKEAKVSVRVLDMWLGVKAYKDGYIWMV